MFIAKINLRYIFGVIGVAIFSSLKLYGSAKYIPIMNEIMPRSSTWVSRIDGFFAPSENHKLNEGYQSNQGKIAIHKGGLFGVGPGESVQRKFCFGLSDR